MNRLAEIASALGDVSRLRIIMMLEEGPRCVCQLTEALELAPSTVSRHLLVLRQAGLIGSFKQGRWIFYYLACDDPAAAKGLKWILGELAASELARQDRQRMIQVQVPDCEGELPIFEKE